MPRRGFIAISSMLLVLSSLNCRRAQSIQPQKGIVMPKKTIEQVQESHTEEWMAIPGVVGTGIGESHGKPCILVFTASNTEEVRKRIPATVDGYPVVVQYTGEIRALEKP